MAAKPPRNCPCFSGERYATCCAPFHRGEREPETPELLMRSRYAAFALGLGEYLVRTLASDHAELDVPRAELVRELSQARERQRFMGLRILHHEASGTEGVVMFYARVFERGADHSFVELSRFVREGDAWRYASGILVPKADLPAGVAPETQALTPADIFGLRTRE
jgi:SEC-C motif-containing protein